MTVSSDFKKLVRERMQKTGESYTTARKFLLAKQRNPVRHTATPYLAVKNAANLLKFLQDVFGAELMYDVQHREDGSFMHAEVVIGDSTIMMGEPRDVDKVMPASIYLKVDNSDESYRRALEHGASPIMEPQDSSHGDRYGGVQDPFGNQWWLASRISN